MQSKAPGIRFLKSAFILLIMTVICLTSVSCASESKKKPSEQETGSESPDVPIEFVVEETQAIVWDKLAKSKSAEIETIKTEESKKIAGVVQGYYETAFLNPKLWKNGEAAKLGSFFSPEAESRIKQEDMQNLTFGDDAKKIDYLESVDAKIPTVWIDIDKNLKPQLCAVATAVEAQFLQTDGKAAHFSSTATMFLEPAEAGKWQIVDCNLKYELKSGAN